MDDSGEMEGAAVHVWAAEYSGNESAGATKVEFTIGELSREFGVTLRALRFYENKGLISPQRDGLQSRGNVTPSSRPALSTSTSCGPPCKVRKLAVVP